MPSLLEDEIFKKIKRLHSAGFKLLEEFANDTESSTLPDLLNPYEELLEETKQKLPTELLDTGYLFQHSTWLSRHIRGGRAKKAHSDIRSICYTDIPKLEQDYIRLWFSSGIQQNWESIHQIIKEISKERFEAKQYADAVRAAFVGLNQIVKQAYMSLEGKERDGVDLMRNAFSYRRNKESNTIVQPPLFKLTDRDLRTETGYNVQEGYANLFVGSIQGIRNPKAHDNLVIKAEEAWEMIVLASHLMRMWDKGQSIK